MEILYYYSSFKDKIEEMNFGGQYKFVNDEDTLSIEINEKYIEGFFNTGDNKNIRNITGIIGKNGSGKTYLIDTLIDIMSYCTNPQKGVHANFDLVVVIEKGNKLYIIYNREKLYIKKDNLLSKDLDIQLLKFEDLFDLDFSCKDTAVVFFSNIFDTSLKKHIRKDNFDISINGMLNYDGKNKSGRSSEDWWLKGYDKVIYNDKSVGFIRRFKFFLLQNEIIYTLNNINYATNKSYIKIPEKLSIIPQYIIESQEANLTYPILRILNEGKRKCCVEKQLTEAILKELDILNEYKNIELSEGNKVKLSKVQYLFGLFSEFFEEVEDLKPNKEGGYKDIIEDNKYVDKIDIYDIQSIREIMNFYIEESIVQIKKLYKKVYKDNSDSRFHNFYHGVHDATKKAKQLFEDYFEVIDKLYALIEGNTDSINVYEDTITMSRKYGKGETIYGIIFKSYSYLSFEIKKINK